MKLAYSSIKRNVSELFVHVVDSCSGLISEHDSESFNVIRSFFENFINSQDLSLGCLSFELSSEMIPIFRFSNNFIGSEKSNSIDFGAWILLSR